MVELDEDEAGTHQKLMARLERLDRWFDGPSPPEDCLLAGNRRYPVDDTASERHSDTNGDAKTGVEVERCYIPGVPPESTATNKEIVNGAGTSATHSAACLSSNTSSVVEIATADRIESEAVRGGCVGRCAKDSMGIFQHHRIGGTSASLRRDRTANKSVSQVGSGDAMPETRRRSQTGQRLPYSDPFQVVMPAVR